MTDYGWGAQPVAGVPVGDLVRVDDDARLLPLTQAGPAASGVRLPVLLGAKGREQVKLADELLSAGLSVTDSRTVMVAGLFGGVGVSTLAAQLAHVWAGCGVPSVSLDAAGGRYPGLLDRFDGDGLLGCPSWDDLAAADEAALAGQFAAAAAAPVGGNIVTSGGLAGPAQVARVAAGAATSWPLVVVDAGTDVWRVEGLARALAPDLLVVVCRPSVREVRLTVDWLREFSFAGIPMADKAVVAVAGVPMMRSAPVSAALAAVWDVAAGAVVQRFEPYLSVRTAAVKSTAARTTRVLAAAAAHG